jgi:hypothetical protein
MNGIDKENVLAQNRFRKEVFYYTWWFVTSCSVSSLLLFEDLTSFGKIPIPHMLSNLQLSSVLGL